MYGLRVETVQYMVYIRLPYVSTASCILVRDSLYFLPDMAAIGDVLRRLRNERKLSLRALGREVGISFNTLSAYERNAVQPTIQNCFTLSRFYEVPVEYFVLGEKAEEAFHDVELRDLIRRIEGLKKADRETVKRYLTRFLAARQEMDAVEQEAAGEESAGRGGGKKSRR
jgi:transcriptional regulator with XRE-family HTH domain